MQWRLRDDRLAQVQPECELSYLKPSKIHSFLISALLRSYAS